MRQDTVIRKTKETDISVELNIDGKGSFEGTSGVGFFDHMLILFAKHSIISLSSKSFPVV